MDQRKAVGLKYIFWLMIHWENTDIPNQQPLPYNYLVNYRMV